MQLIRIAPSIPNSCERGVSCIIIPPKALCPYRQSNLHSGVYDLHQRIVKQATLYALRTWGPERIVRGHVVGGLAAIPVRLKPGDAARAKVKQIAVLKEDRDYDYCACHSVSILYPVQNSHVQVEANEEGVPADPQEIPY